MAERGRRNLVIAATLLLALQIGLGLLVARVYLSSHHTLYNNGNWTATKTTLEEGVMGAYSYLFSLQPMRQGRLDLTAWHGYQEVVLAATVDPQVVEVDFRLVPDAWLAVEIDRDEKGYSGVRVSRHPLFPPIAFEASAEGEFRWRQPMKKLGRARAGWRTLRLELGKRKTRVLLDGKRVGAFPGNRTGPQRIGFRAGRARVWIDDVRVVERDGSVFRDDFERPRKAPVVYLLAATLLPLVSGALFLLLRRRAASERRLLFFFLMFTGVLIVVTAVAGGYVAYRKGFYPDQSERLRREEAYWRNELEERIFQSIAEEHPATPEPLVHRLLFLGSSQTRGAGARTTQETWVRRVERLLNERAGGERYETINTGVSAYRLADMARVFDQHWTALEPDTVVVNASNNDLGGDPLDFERTLTGLVRRVQATGAQVVLVMEPNSVERDWPVLRQFHARMAEVARREGAVAIDQHAALVARHDDGFLWWDWVHLTSYGQRLFAEELVEALVRTGVVDPAAAQPPPKT